MWAAILLALLAFPSHNAPMQTQTSELQARLDGRVSQYSVSANGLAGALLKIAKQFHLPVGIEWVRDNQTAQVVSLRWRDDTVADVVSSVVKRYPGYGFAVENGVVHVFRRDLLDGKSNFLNLRVPGYFEARQEVCGVINQRLQHEVQGVVSPRNLLPGAGVGGSYATGIEEKPLTLALQGLTVRAALEKLAAASERKVWVVTFADGPGLTPTGFRRTETLWHPRPFPDSEQPVWDLLAWQDL